MIGFVMEDELVRSMRGHLPELLRSDPSLDDHAVNGRSKRPRISVSGRNRKLRIKRRWDEQNLKWEESNRRFDEVNEKLDRLERSTATVGARWGTRSERAFHDASAAILEESFGVEVLNVTESDDEGEVFGRLDQVELDVIIKNGLLILCKLKLSMSKSDMHTFERKVQFYEKRHHRRANQMIVVSPMIDEFARPVGKINQVPTPHGRLECPKTHLVERQRPKGHGA